MNALLNDRRVILPILVTAVLIAVGSVLIIMLSDAIVELGVVLALAAFVLLRRREAITPHARANWTQLG